MPLRLPRKFHCAIIYATPGSGKTYIANKYDDVIDTDELIMIAANEISPSFQEHNVDDPRKNIFHYMRYINFNPKVMNKVYERTVELMEFHTSRGRVVLTGTTKLMYIADYVFILENDNIVRDNFDQERESNIADDDADDRAIYYFSSYLEQFLLRF